MLRIVIVDDEVLIREGLAAMIGKESRCFQVVGSFPGGREALEAIPELHPDVVVTDIRMPGVDGLTLIKTLKVDRPDIRTILMSGFTEFNYAREAIRASVVDYLLKPINKDQLFELLYRLDEEALQARERESRVRVRVMQSCLHTDAGPDHLLRELMLPGRHYVLMVHKAASADALEQGVGRVLRQDLPIFDRIAVYDRLQVLALYFDQPPGASELSAWAEPLLDAGGEQAVHCGASRVRSDPCELRAAYLEAKKACDAGIYGRTLRHFAQAGTEEPRLLQDARREPPHLPDWNALSESLQILHIPQIVEWIGRELDQLQSKAAGPEDIVRFCRDIEDAAAKEIQEFEAFREAAFPKGIESELLLGMSFACMRRRCLSYISGILDRVGQSRSEMGGKAVEHVKRWIAANYSQHAELNTLAAMVYLTPSYLSKLFKQETGMTLTEYITDIRIRRAKQLLRTEQGMKVHRIGAEVGYSDPAYFNKLFKRMVGVTPNEYKRIQH